MPGKTMKTTLKVIIPICMFLFVPSIGFAMMHIEFLSKERAKELGMEVRAIEAGQEAVRVELEFDVKGELKSFARVDLELHDGKKLLAMSTLREERSATGRVVVGFAADRTHLDKITLRVVVQPSLRTMIGYEIRVKDFVGLKKGL